MRHTFAHRLLETTNDIRLVAQALGHSDVRVTMKYTERTDEDVARAMEDSVKMSNKQMAHLARTK
jgi:site-specific recombinase XerD